MAPRHRYTEAPTPCVAEWTSVKALAHRAEAWRALARRSIDPNPFYDYDYLQASAALARSDIRCIAVFRDGACDSELVGLFPLQRASILEGALIPAMEFYRNDYVCLTTPLIDRDHAPQVWASFLDRCAQTPGQPQTILSNLTPAARDTLASLSDVLAERGLPLIEIDRHNRAALNMPERFEHAYRRISSNRRSDMARRRRRMRADGPARMVSAKGGEPGAQDMIEAFLTIEAAGWKGKAGTAMACSPATRAFTEQVFNAPNAELYGLLFKDEIVAVEASLVSQGAVYSVKTAYAEEHARYAPGLLLGLHMIRRMVLETGYVRVDSCAVENHVINDLWLDREPISSIAFGTSTHVTHGKLEMLSRLISSTKTLKNWLRETLARR